MSFLKVISCLVVLFAFSGLVQAGDKVRKAIEEERLERISQMRQARDVALSKFTQLDGCAPLDPNFLPDSAFASKSLTLYVKPKLPNVFEVCDGVLFIQKSSLCGLSVLQDLRVAKKTLPAVRRFRLPFISGNGVRMRNVEGSHHSIYYLTYNNASEPMTIKASGRAVIVFLGDHHRTQDLNILLKDDARLYVDQAHLTNLSLDVRGSAQCHIGGGSVTKMYVSAQGVRSCVAVGGLVAQDVTVNTSHRECGIVVVNPTIRFCTVGKNTEKLTNKNQSILAKALSPAAFKAKRFMGKTLPRFCRTLFFSCGAAVVAVLPIWSTLGMEYVINRSESKPFRPMNEAPLNYL